MKTKNNYITIGCTLKTKYKNEKVLNMFNAYVKLNLMYFQNVLRVEKINYTTLIKESMKDMINENKDIVNIAHFHINNFQLYFDNNLLLITKTDY